MEGGFRQGLFQAPRASHVSVASTLDLRPKHFKQIFRVLGPVHRITGANDLSALPPPLCPGPLISRSPDLLPGPNNLWCPRKVRFVVVHAKRPLSQVCLSPGSGGWRRTCRGPRVTRISVLPALLTQSPAGGHTEARFSLGTPRGRRRGKNRSDGGSDAVQCAEAVCWPLVFRDKGRIWGARRQNTWGCCCEEVGCQATSPAHVQAMRGRERMWGPGGVGGVCTLCLM